MAIVALISNTSSLLQVTSASKLKLTDSPAPSVYQSHPQLIEPNSQITPGILGSSLILMVSGKSITISVSRASPSHRFS